MECAPGMHQVYTMQDKFAWSLPVIIQPPPGANSMSERSFSISTNLTNRLFKHFYRMLRRATLKYLYKDLSMFQMSVVSSIKLRSGLFQSQMYDARTPYVSSQTTSMLSDLRERLFTFPSSVAALRDASFINSINLVIKVTWVDVRPPGSTEDEVSVIR